MALAASSRGSCGRLSLRRRCLMMVKQQKTRFYILGRCVFMLLCWHAHDYSD
ncbi:DVL protein [Dioscorea alata]|uniref:DVL protein n=1 Tax=Dioscorea alata TaxID=55571 RepID=A0ACB7WER3_DIOAL|nr:DVL protein [Dioscorea alata]